MSSLKTTLRLAALTAGVALVAAPRTAAFQRPPPDPWGAASVQAGDCLGYGKGEITLPVVGEDGWMNGILVDCEHASQFRLEALLTGCMPAQSVGEKGYWFGGVYGRVWSFEKLAKQTPFVPAEASYALEGTWRVYENGEGSFVAQALEFTATGRLDVAGDLQGKFRVSAGDPLGLTATWSDAFVPTKPTKSRYGDAASQEPAPVFYRDAASAPHKGTGGKSRYGGAASQEPAPVFFRDAASAPRKDTGGKSRYGDAASQGSEPVFYRDAASAPHKGTGGKSRYRDAASQPTLPLMTGCFYLRFRFYE